MIIENIYSPREQVRLSTFEEEDQVGVVNHIQQASDSTISRARLLK